MEDSYTAGSGAGAHPLLVLIKAATPIKVLKYLNYKDTRQA
jgi:hypothetical protein